MHDRAEGELRTRARQQATAAALGQRALAGMPLDQLLQEAVEVLFTELRVDAVSLLELSADGKTLSVRANQGFPVQDGETLELAERSLAGYTLRYEGPVISADLRADSRFLQSPVLDAAGVVSAMAVTVGGRDGPFGVIGAHSRASHRFTDDDASFVQAVANTVGAAVQRARAEEAVRESEARFRELADTAPALMWMTDDQGRVTFVNEGWLRFTGRTREEEIGDTWASSAHPADADALRSGFRDALESRAGFRMEYRLLRADGTHRWILEVGAPRFSGGRFVGYVGTATDIHERKAMEQALRRGYEEEHRVAETLQRSLLPEQLPQIQGVDLAARYLPAGSGPAVGGDWYDALELDDGRVALVVGDVVGHGLRAAAAMGQLRNAFRAYAVMEAGTAETVARIDRLVRRGGEQSMATMLYVVLDRDTGEIRYTSAGHPPPLVLAPAGPRYLEGGRSVPIGAGDTGLYREARDVLPPGSTLLLYTDGLVERRDTPLDQRFAELCAVAVSAGPDLATLCDQVVAHLVGDTPADDVAVLAVRPRPVGSESFAMALPADPEALSGLRRSLGRFLRAAGASEQERYEITLAVAEAACNAIEHAYGPSDATVDVEAELDGRDLTVGVRDRGSWREPRGEHRGRGITIIGALMHAFEVERGEAGTLVRMSRRLGG